MRVASFALALAAVTALAGCGGDKSTGPGAIAGNYRMRSVNGETLPVVLEEFGSYRAELTAASLTLDDDGRFTESSTVRETDGGQTVTTIGSCPGSYTRGGSTITFEEDASSNDYCGFSYTATWTTGNTLTVDFGPGSEAVYRK
jgi:hypothetical protein